MSPSDDPLERNVERLLARGAADPTAAPAFRERLRNLLLAEAARRADGQPGPVAPPVRRPRSWRRATTAVAAVALAAAAAWMIAAGGDTARPPALSRVSGVHPSILRAPPDRRGAAELATPSGASPVARIDLGDGAEAVYQAGLPASIRVVRGHARVFTRTAVQLRASDVAMEVAQDTECELEVREQGEPQMRKQWLIPTVTVAGAAALVAVLVHKGKIEIRGGAGSAGRTPPPGELVVLRSSAQTSEGARLHQAERRIVELEKKLEAARKESERLAGELVNKKGVTVASIVSRIGELKKTQLGMLIAPGKMADLVSDLKGLGPTGVNAVVDLLKSGDPKERFLAAKLLEDLSAPASIPALREAALKDSDAMAANMATHALALMDDPGTVDALREIVDTKASWEFQVNALWGLCKHNDPDGLERAMAFMKSDKTGAQARAALGANLMLLTDEALLPLVDETARQFPDQPRVMGMAVEYYKNLGTPAARERLQAMAGNAKLPEPIRQSARQALGG